MTFVLSLVGIAVSLLLSPGLMYLLGINYATESGSIVEKIHISTQILSLVAVFAIVSSGRIVLGLSSAGPYLFMLCVLFVTTIALVLLGRQITGVLVTFLTPIALVYIIGLMRAAAREVVRKLVLAILFVNSLVGLVEIGLGHTFLPLMAGAVVVHNDVRAIGLVGHPLTSSFLTGMVVVYLVVSQHASLSRSSLLQLGVHIPALLAFGGRVALVAAVVISLYFMLFGTGVNRHAGSLAILRRVGFVAATAAIFAAVLASGFVDNTLSRFAADGGSALTRNTALQIVGSLSADELAFGISAAERKAIQRAFGTEFGIEVTWLSWIVDFGALVTVALCTLLGLLIAICLRDKQPYRWYLTIYFLACISGSLGLGSKSLMLAWFVIVMLTFGVGSGTADRTTLARMRSATQRP